MAESVTVRLPEEALHRPRRGAGAAGKPLEEFLADRLMDAVPPLSVFSFQDGAFWFPASLMER